MRVLVVGASGLVGEALTRALERDGNEVLGTACSRASNALKKLDVRDSAQVEACLAAFRPDVVFLTVNVPGGTDFCEDHPDLTRAILAEGTRNLAGATARHNAKLVYYSTDYIFDGRSGPYGEDEPPSPISVYGRAKWEGEEAIRQAGPSHLILRTTAVYGWNRTSLNFAMQLWSRLQAGEAMRVPDDQWCNPTLADYLAEISVRLLQMGCTGVFNVVGKDRVTRYDLAQTLARTMGLDPSLLQPVHTAELAPKAPRPLQGGLSTDKLTEVLGTAALDLTESMKRLRRQWRADTHVAAGPQKSPTQAERLKQEILGKVKEYYDLVHRPKPLVPFKSRVQYAGRVFGPEEMVNLVDSSLDFWLTLGPYGELFEFKMKKYFGARDFVLVNSGSTANLTAVMALMSPQLENPLRAGDEVITPAVTFPTTIAPLVHGGLLPVFVDCEVGTYNINPRLLEEAVSEKTRAIMIPHTLGNPCHMDLVCEVARRHHLYLIEDTCDALGATYGGRLAGTFGDLATLSFFPAHHMTMGEGGGIVVNKARLARVVRSIRDWGRDCWCAPGESNSCGKRFGWELGELPRGYDHKYIYSNLGYNFKPTDMQAAVGIAQLDRVPQFVERRRENFKALYAGLEPLQEWLILPVHEPKANPSWFGFPITVREGVSIDRLIQWLETANIETRKVFGGNILKQPGYRNIPHRICGGLEQSDVIMRSTFFIGVYPGLTAEMIDFVIDRFRKFFRR